MKFIVSDLAKPLLLKEYLRNYIKLSLTEWRKIKHSGNLKVNNIIVPATYLVKAGDIITIPVISNCEIEPIYLPLDIVYEDDYLLVVNKPAGLLVHPVFSEKTVTLANGIMYYYQSNKLPYGFHPIHRLDRNTSGLIVIAKISHVQHLLSCDNIKSISRYYTAIVEGIVQPIEGLIDAPIGRLPGSIIQRMVCSNGQSAQTYYKVEKFFKNTTMVELKLLTGRTHQIRVHMSSIGHPLLGDDLYGGNINKITRQALHAGTLKFRHPILKNNIQLFAQLPNDMLNLITLLN